MEAKLFIAAKTTIIMALFDSLWSILLLIIVAIFGWKILKNVLHIAILVIALALVLWFFGFLSF